MVLLTSVVAVDSGLKLFAPLSSGPRKKLNISKLNEVKSHAS